MASEDDFSLRLDSFSCNDAIEFGNHKNADHLIRPVLKVPAIEVRDVRDRQSSGFVVGHVDGRSWNLKDKNLGVCQYVG